MKKSARKARNAIVFLMGVGCAMIGPFVGWVLSGLCPGGFEYFLRNYPAKVAVYAAIGFCVGIAAGALLSTLDYINKREKEEEDKISKRD